MEVEELHVIRQNWSPPCVVTTRIKNARKKQLLTTYHLHHGHDVLVLALAVRKAGLLTDAGTIVSASTGSSSSTGSAHQGSRSVYGIRGVRSLSDAAMARIAKI